MKVKVFRARGLSRVYINTLEIFKKPLKHIRETNWFQPDTSFSFSAIQILMIDCRVTPSRLDSLSINRINQTIDVKYGQRGALKQLMVLIVQRLYKYRKL